MDPLSLDREKAPPLHPSGLVLGSDGKPCKPCTAFRNWNWRIAKKTSSIGDAERRRDPQTSGADGLAMTAAVTNGSTTTTTTTIPTTTTSSRPDEPPENCPPDVEQMGRATWTFLHSTAAYYPDKPTPTQRAHMLSLLHAIPVLYACSSCATDFGEDIGRHPPDVGSRERLTRWLCERHNEVNRKLGKEAYDCSLVDERWRDGPPDGRCD